MAGNLGLTLPFPPSTLEELSIRAKNYALMNGLVIGRASEPGNMDLRTHITLTLLPTPIPKTVFENLCQFQTDYMELYSRVAHDLDFLEEHLKPVAEVDDFVKRLLDIHYQVKDKSRDEHKCLCLARNDFMLDDVGANLVPKQIEINTIAASFGGLGTRLREYHGYILRTLGCGDVTSQIPVSKLDDNFADAFVRAYDLYGVTGAVIIFAAENENRNICDQRFLEHAIYRKNPNLRVMFRSLLQINETIRVEDSGKLFIEDFEVALVYFRTAYSPANAGGEVGWKVRLLIEKSNALKSPCIHTHLVGCKKIQQVLCQEGIVEKYVNKRAAQRIRETFALQYATDQTPAGDLAVKLATENPHKYVLKTQREGGGNNIYGPDIVEEFERLKDSDERGKYVLMERIFPKEYDNHIMVGERETEFGKTVSELGLYVSSVWDGGTVETKFCGQFYRTKLKDRDEGGVMVGISALDSLLLV